ncbi:TetR/AcrR family transcriptional regulator [Pseudomonas aeruginosa]|uniref:TetR/AcrR family transcriptional regulator n=1 Tax=Pseudomonas aeruginosa TaxID=287 RepID=UPI002A69C2A6|nr:TetR/AcrR family transcriptional regulator [Pseudomonas aeruginosa]MDY1247789.1 TetR/AcrR family transcriptional regulator [Pseudomonas aeruginosa]HCF9805933.1 TetR/AcrR family transcriptional regulator [Pseudomonas aeruginosa]
MPDSRRSAPAGTRRPTAEAKPVQRARRGRPVGNHEEKRTELLLAVIAVIAQEGYAGASMRKVAQQAGCTTGAVTYYFANKEEMVTAAVQYLFDEFDTLLDADVESFDIGELIKEWLNWTKADEPNSWLALFQLMAHARHEPAFAEVFQLRYSRFREVFSSILAQGQRDGMIRDDIDASVLSDLISAMGDGWMMAKPIEPNRFTPARKKALLSAVLALITPPVAQAKPAATGKGRAGKK